jgi:hypothetical protein
MKRHKVFRPADLDKELKEIEYRKTNHLKVKAKKS